MQYNASDILNYPANHHNPTTQTNYANNVKNWVETEKSLVDTILWQPTTAYSVGNIVKTPSLPSQYCLVCTTAGTSGANEPSYNGKTVGSSVSDGNITWMVSGFFLTDSNYLKTSVYGISTNRNFLNFYLNTTNPEQASEGMQLHSTGLQLYGKNLFTKNIYLNGEGDIFGSKSSGGFVLYCGSNNVDPSLAMWGSNSSSSAGYFRLRATLSGDSSRTKDLIGTPDGSLKWGGQSIQTSSDKRLKTDFTDVPTDVLEAWANVEWKQFKYIADKERKGDSCRWHTGLVAQDVQDICGDEIMQYGILCHDVQEATEEQEAIDMWTVRYTEALCMEVIYLRHKIADLESRLQAVENRK